MAFTELIYTVYDTIILLVRQGICDSVVFFSMIVAIHYIRCHKEDYHET